MMYIDPSWPWYKRWYYTTFITLILLVVVVYGFFDGIFNRKKK